MAAQIISPLRIIRRVAIVARVDRHLDMNRVAAVLNVKIEDSLVTPILTKIVVGQSMMLF